MILLIFLFPLIFCCPESSVSDDKITLEKDCEVSIQPSSESAIQLKLPCNNEIKIWLLAEDQSIFHSIFNETCTRTELHTQTWTAPKKTGVKLVLISENSIQIPLIHIHDQNICSYPIVRLTTNFTQIQEDVFFSDYESCVYRLIPSEEIRKTFNRVHIAFNGLTTNYEMRRGVLNFAFNGQQDFLLEEFDIALDALTQPPNTTATLKFDKCQNGLKILEIPKENLTTSVIMEPDWVDKCQHMKSIYELKFLDLANDEIVVFKTDLQWQKRTYSNEVTFKLSDLDGRLLMNNSHHLNIAAFKTKGLRVEFYTINNYETVTIDFIRLKIDHKCRRDLFGSETITREGRYWTVIPKHCRNVFIHWRFQNTHQHLGLTHINLHVKVENAGDGDLLESDHLSYENEESEELAKDFEIQRVFSTVKDSLEFAFIRFNQSEFNNNDTEIMISWNFNTGYDCPVENNYTIPISTSMNLTSPNYPNSFTTNMNCDTYIQTNDNGVLEIKINKLYIVNGELKVIEEKFENTTILDGPQTKLVFGPRIQLNFQSSDEHPGLKEKYHITITSRLNDSIPTQTPTTRIPTTQIPTTSQISTTTETPAESAHSHTFIIISFLFFAILLVVFGFLYQQRNLKRAQRRMRFTADAPNSRLDFFR